MRVRNRAISVDVLGHPLVRASRALRQLPVVLEKVLQEVVAPFRRSSGPGDFQAAANRVVATAGAVGIAPPHSLRFNGSCLRLWPDVLVRIGCAVRLAER